jgi:hypothetical protein
MRAPAKIWTLTGVVAAVAFAAIWAHSVRAEPSPEFHVVGNLKLPPTGVPNDYHHLHLSETDTERFLTVTDSKNVMTIVDVTEGSSPRLAGQVPLPASVAHGDPVILMGGVALIAQPGKSEAWGPKTITIVNLTRRSGCNVTGKFENVTGMEIDSTQSHIYLISGNDLWILGGRQHWHASFSK